MDMKTGTQRNRQIQKRKQNTWRKTDYRLNYNDNYLGGGVKEEERKRCNKIGESAMNFNACHQH